MPHTDTLDDFSTALNARIRSARPLIAEIRAGRRTRSGTVWRRSVVVTSEQTLPDADEFEVVHAEGTTHGKIAGRDKGTNLALIALDHPVSPTLRVAAEAEVGTLALALGADGYGGATANLGVVSLAAPAWHSRAGGKIDRRIHLDLRLSYAHEGGPVLDAAGNLLGISTLGPHGQAIVIPSSTVERTIDPLLSDGRIARGWLGVALQTVAVPEALHAMAGQQSGLMVMSIVSDGPADSAKVLVGDIILQLSGMPISRLRQLAERLGPESVGKTFELKLIRAGALATASVAVAARPKDS